MTPVVRAVAPRQTRQVSGTIVTAPGTTRGASTASAEQTSTSTTRDRDRDRDRSRYLVLLLLPLAVGLALRIGLALSDDVIGPDTSAYLESGRNLLEGDGLTRDDGRPELHFPPATSVVMGAAWMASGSPLAASATVTVVASTLVLLPLAAIARRLGGDAAGIAACWVGALAPGLSSIPATAGGGSEMPYVLFLLTMVWLLAGQGERSGRARSVAAAGAGVAGGVAYLTRPEALLVMFALVIAVALASGIVGDVRARRLRPSGVAHRLGPVALMVVVMAAVAFPYLLFLHGHTGSWSPTAKSRDVSIGAWRAVAEGDRGRRDAILYELDADGTGFRAETTSLTTLARENPATYRGIVDVNVRRLVGHVVGPSTVGDSPFPRWALIPLPVSVLAVWGAWRVRRDRALWLLLGVAGPAMLTAVGFFVQARYLLAPVAAVSVLAGVGLARLRPTLRTVAGVTAFALLAVPVAADIGRDKGIFRSREPVEDQLAGTWLARNTPPSSRVMGRSLVTEFYSRRTGVALPAASLERTVAFAYHHGVDYVVVDSLLVRRFRPQLTSLFDEGPWAGLTLVHSSTYQNRHTRIFALDPAPVGDSPDAPALGFVGDG